jgi:hypothetical protein
MKTKVLTIISIAGLAMAGLTTTAQAQMPIEARQTAYFVGKAAAQLPPGYITEEFLKKLAIATGCNTQFWIEDFIHTERDQEEYFRKH